MSVAQGHGGRPSAGSRSRYRPRQEVARVRSVKFRLTEEEFGELAEAAGRARMAMAAYAAALSPARGAAAVPDEQLREAQADACAHDGLPFQGPPGGLHQNNTHTGIFGGTS
jgi:hypothetical protein